MIRFQRDPDIFGSAVRRMIETDLPLAMLRDLRLRTYLHRRLGIASEAPSAESR